MSKIALCQVAYGGFLVEKGRLVRLHKAPFFGNSSSIEDQSKFDCSSKQLELNRKSG
jgi:hypothetical protein